MSNSIKSRLQKLEAAKGDVRLVITWHDEGELTNEERARLKAAGQLIELSWDDTPEMEGNDEG